MDYEIANRGKMLYSPTNCLASYLLKPAGSIYINCWLFREQAVHAKHTNKLRDYFRIISYICGLFDIKI